MLPLGEHQIGNFGKWINIVLKNVGESHHFASFADIGVADNAVTEVVGRHHIFQRAVVGYILNAYFFDVESVVDAER